MAQRYFFDVFDGRKVVTDVEGQEVLDAVVLLREATGVARELIVMVLGRGDHLDGRELRVRDTSGRVVLTLSLRDMVTREGAQASISSDYHQSAKPPCAGCLKLEGWRPSPV